MKRRSKPDIELGLDSLADIITNSVGILVILGVFVSLGTLGKSETLEVPLPRAPSVAPEYFICQEDRFAPIDKTEILQEIVARLAADSEAEYETGSFDLGHPVVDIALIDNGFDSTHQLKMKLELRPRPQTKGRGLSKKEVRAQFSDRSETSFAYFFVYPRCFPAYQALRKELLTINIKVGFTPVDTGTPAFFCTRFKDCVRESM